MTYPTSTKWAAYARTARATASEYRRDADTQKEPYRSQWEGRS